jgi:hypothetical protein
MKHRVLAVEGGVLFLLGTASIISGRYVGAAILVGLAVLAVAAAWALRLMDQESVED